FVRGRILLEVAVGRLEGLIDTDKRYVCTGEKFREAITQAIGSIGDEQVIGEPEGRDTLAAVGLPAAVLSRQDPEAVIATFTADHLIEPEDVFRARVEIGLRIAHEQPDTLVTFGIQPTHAATGYGYVKCGAELNGYAGAWAVDSFKEKPDEATAQSYLDSGGYLWNSGMFVWRASTLMRCIERFQPQVHAGLVQIAEAWGGPDRQAVLAEVYPSLQKISVDYAVMERATVDDTVSVACVSMPVSWLDVGGWPSYAQTVEVDDEGNRVTGCRFAALDSSDNLVVGSDPTRLIATIGVKGLVIVQTEDATLICHRDEAERIKQMHALIDQGWGCEYL
ncbi:MAG: mannose-1-phosphate guanylyltransferase, partial [Planctomycetota bacterium]